MKLIYNYSKTNDLIGYKPNHSPLTIKDVKDCQQLPGGEWRNERNDGTIVRLSEDRLKARVLLLVGNNLVSNQYLDFYSIEL